MRLMKILIALAIALTLCAAPALAERVPPSLLSIITIAMNT